MIMLLAPFAVGLLGVATKAAKQWKAGKEIKSTETAVVSMLVTRKEWDMITTSENAKEVRDALNKGIYRHAVAAAAAAVQKGAI
jgi:hypothetical protein